VKRLLAACGVLAMGACTKVEDASTTTRAGARKVVDSSRTSRPSGLEKLIVDLESCGLEGYQITSTCPAMIALTAELSQRAPGTAELSVALGAKLLAERSPAVRVQAAAMLGHDAGSRDTIVDAARREVDPRVREAMIHTIGPDAARYPRVATFLLESTQHASSSVRARSLEALTLPANRTVPGGAERVLAMAERDPDPQLRREACSSGGKLGHAAFLPFYERITDSAADPAMYAACMEGVVAMFHNAPAFDTSSEGAYRLFIRRVEAQPRTEQSPPWQVMSAFCYDSREADLERLAAWRRQATWFDPNAVKTALTAVIADPAASWKARAAAVESMVGLGATKAELKALETTAQAPADMRVLATLDRALAE
jgi:hypothetical protein